MEITRRTVKRTITEEEMLRLKGVEPFAQFRQDSKGINFGMIFGISYKKFSASSLETSWTQERVREFIAQRKLQKQVNKMAEAHPYAEAKLWEYYAVSDYIRKNFFLTYPGLMDRIKRNEQFAKDNGYVRSYHGAIRRVPMLMFCMGDEEKLRKDENKKEIANLINITSNSTIQTDESTVVNLSIVKWNKANKPEHYVIGTVHDSVDFYIRKTEAKYLLPKIKGMFEVKNDPWVRGLDCLVDIIICDLTKPDTYYKHGISLKKFMEEV